MMQMQRCGSYEYDPHLFAYWPFRIGCRRAHGMMAAGGCCFIRRWRMRSI